MLRSRAFRDLDRDPARDRDRDRRHLGGSTSGDDSEKFDVGYVGAEAERVVDRPQKRQAAFDAEITSREFGDEEAARAAVADEDVDAAVVAAGLVARIGPVGHARLAAAERLGRRSARRRCSRGRASARARSRRRSSRSRCRSSEVGEPASGERDRVHRQPAALHRDPRLRDRGRDRGRRREASRVVEVVLSAIRPVQLLTGKVLGIGLLGLGQVLLIAGAGLAIAVAPRARSTSRARPRRRRSWSSSTSSSATCSTLRPSPSPARSSRARRTCRRSSAPLSILLVGGYLAGISTIDAPDGTPGDRVHLPAPGGADGGSRARGPGRAAALGARRSRSC